ncbi:MAG TPA: hypothetical protein VFE23_01420 [Usitatibacter sp.]|jgi:hypothetical protein|nr:hypothetical protein [Usitatibacter sp.]
MNRSILLASLCAVTLAGCGHTVYRETVVEKQPVVTRETVVERPAPARETVIAVPATIPAQTVAACSLGVAAYSAGTLSCQAGYQYQCVNGAWEPVPGGTC